MDWDINRTSVNSFLDTPIELPRFQRRDTWNETQRFKLSISVFKGFPLGVVLVSKQQNQKWLLDGRQRRTTLNALFKNPVAVYNWAIKAKVFTPGDDESTNRKRYWSKIKEYLESDLDKTIDNDNETNNSKTMESSDDEIVNEDVNENELAEAEIIENGLIEQEQNLRTLLDLLLMIGAKKKHKNEPDRTEWEDSFNFCHYFTKFNDYLDDDKRIDPAKLKQFILDYIKKQKLLNGKSYLPFGESFAFTADDFINTLLEEKSIKDETNEKYFREHIRDHWDGNSGIKNSFTVISHIDKIFEDANIGMITIKYANDLDSLNIFTLVNTGGTPLKAEELLSAKPFWNKPVEINDQDVNKAVENLYSKLAISTPNNQSKIVRWDLCAVILSLIDKNHYIFKNYDEDIKKKEKNFEIALEKITLGFKLVSTILVKGISGKAEAEMESEDFIDKLDYLRLVKNLNYVIENIIEDNTYFDTLHNSWHQSVSDILTASQTLEFIGTIYHEWKKYDSNNTVARNKTQLREFKQRAVILFDRLVYENTKGLWGGSSDSRLANDLKDTTRSTNILTPEEWQQFIKENCKQTKIGYTKFKPFLYHYYILANINPEKDGGKYTIDHIMSQQLFKDNNGLSSDQQKFGAALGNLELLPDKVNSVKKENLLETLPDEVKKSVEHYSEIKRSKFSKYSQPTEIKKLVEEREKNFCSVFGQKRTDYIAKMLVD